MGARGVHIERILIRDLYDFACETIEQSSDQDIIPITPQRALAQTKNPYADGEGVGLLAAYSNGEIIGYQGLLPGRLRWHDSLTTVYYGSTSYVAREYRKKLVGFAFMQEVLSLPCDYVATGFNENGKSLCEAFRLPTIGPLEYYTLNVDKLKKWNPVSLPVRLLRKVLMKAAGVRPNILESTARRSDRLASACVKRTLYHLFLHSQRKQLRHVRWETVSRFGDEEARLIENQQTGSVFYRGVECINWMLDHQWVLEAAEATGQLLHYNFTHVRDVFRYIPLRIYSTDEGDYLGFLTLSVSAENGKTCLRVLDTGCTDPSGYRYVASIAMKYAAAYLADRVIMPCAVADCLNGTFPVKHFCQKQTRIYYCRPYHEQSPLAAALSDLQLSYCDGDCAFT